MTFTLTLIITTVSIQLLLHVCLAHPEPPLIQVAEDVTTYSTLLRYAATAQDYSMLEALRLEMLEAGLMPNVFTFETLIGADAFPRPSHPLVFRGMLGVLPIPLLWRECRR